MSEIIKVKIPKVFCGKDHKVFGVYGSWRGNRSFAIECETCGIRTARRSGTERGVADAIKAWQKKNVPGYAPISILKYNLTLKNPPRV
jgi:hypothetical protein